VKVIAIQGSPHKGNTYSRVERFGEILKTLGDITYEHIPLAEYEIRPCKGCFLCFTRGEATCPLNDDRVLIETKMKEANAVVFATPVYSMQISYLLKRFVDRIAYTFHRPGYFDTFAVGMGVTGGLGLNEAISYIRMFSGSWGFRYIGDLRYIDPPRNTHMIPLMNEPDRTEEIASKLYRTMQKNPPRRLTRNDYLHFYAMREVYSRAGSFLPTDYEYWKNKGWLDPRTSYFTTHAKENVLKSLIPRFMAWMMGRNMDKSMRKTGQPRPDNDI
jgi:hypothetical protein